MALLLFGLWIVLSGRVSPWVCVTGAAVSAALYLFAWKVLGYSPETDRLAARRLWRGVRYLGYVLAEMLKAGLVVMKLIYTKGRNMEPRLIYFRTGLTGDNARAALADAITLTAGTITVSQEGEALCVHALDASLAEGIENSGFQRRLEGLEGQPVSTDLI